MPSWMTADLDYYTEMYESSGFRGGLNWYRAFPNLLKDTESLEGVKVPQPCILSKGPMTSLSQDDSQRPPRCSM